MLTGLALMLTACGVDDGQPEAENAKNPESEPTDLKKAAAGKREMIVKLEQTAEPVAREKAVQEIKKSEEFKNGMMGEPTDETARKMSIQAIEMPAVEAALAKAYGSREEFMNAGIVYLEVWEEEYEKPGIWVGIKNPDERTGQLEEILQAKADAGEISADYIHIYKAEYTENDMREIENTAYQLLKTMQEEHYRPQSAVGGASLDIKTGKLTVSHNFLTEEQKTEVVAAFPELEVTFEQLGAMVPGEGEPDVLYPEPAVTEEPNTEGEYIFNVSEDKFLSGSTYYSFENADEKLKAGQRVEVGTTGSIAASYPGQGTAVVVEVMPTYQPEGADLTEEMAVRKALEDWEFGMDGIPMIRPEYDNQSDRWNIEFTYNWDGEKTETVTVDDK